MKKIILLAILGVSLLILPNSCRNVDKLSETPAFRRIINETDYFVEIMVGGDVTKDTLIYQLAPQETLDIKGKCYEGIINMCELGWSHFPYGNIIFNNERIQKFDIETYSLYYTGRAINSSVYNSYSYELVEDTPELRIYQYKITQTDYNTAEIL